jgi:hypothetical protein
MRLMKWRGMFRVREERQDELTEQQDRMEQYAVSNVSFSNKNAVGWEWNQDFSVLFLSLLV